MHSVFFAAKHYESAAGCAYRASEEQEGAAGECQERRVLLVDEAAQLMLEAAARYQQSNHIDRCIECYSKAAK